MMAGPGYYLALSGLLFVIGGLGVLCRRNVLILLMSVEVMMNAGNLAFLAFAREFGTMDGHAAALFVIVLAAAEAAVGLAIVVAQFRNRGTAMVDEANRLKG